MSPDPSSTLGHLWVTLTSPDGSSSYGFYPQHNGQSRDRGEVRTGDSATHYPLGTVVSNTLNISESQFNKMKDFAENPRMHGFNTYNGDPVFEKQTTCVQFGWGVIHAGGIDPAHNFGNSLLPGNNWDDVRHLNPTKDRSPSANGGIGSLNSGSFPDPETQRALNDLTPNQLRDLIYGGAWTPQPSTNGPGPGGSNDGSLPGAYPGSGITPGGGVFQGGPQTSGNSGFGLGGPDSAGGGAGGPGGPFGPNSGPQVGGSGNSNNPSNGWYDPSVQDAPSGGGTSHYTDNSGGNGPGNTPNYSDPNQNYSDPANYNAGSNNYGGTGSGTNTLSDGTGGDTLGTTTDSPTVTTPPPNSWGYGYDGPILLNITSQNINITELSRSNTFLDSTGSGLQHRTAWAGAGTGVLFYDVNSTSTITQKNEYVFTEWDPTATSDMQALRNVFDSNGDGKFDASDAKWFNFKVMVTNADGTQTALTMAQAGITSINLKADNTNVQYSDGSAITGQTSFTRTNGGTGTVGSASLAYDTAGHAVKIVKRMRRRAANDNAARLARAA